MRALVLGATGFIGGHIAQAALEAKWTVRALRRNPENTGLLRDLSAMWVEGDLDQPTDLERIFQDIDVVFHAAGYYPSDSKNVPAQVAHSMQQTSNVLDLMRAGGVKRLVYTSSFTTMVPPETRTLDGADEWEQFPPDVSATAPGVADEEDQYIPGMLARSAYYECKTAMERLLLEAVKDDFEIVILNPTMVLGPGENTRGIGSIFIALASGRGVAWLPAKVNVVDVRDVARGHLHAAQIGRSGQRYLLSGHNMELRQFMRCVSKLAGVRGPRLKLPLGLVDLLVWLEDHVPAVDGFANHLRAIRFWPYFTHRKASMDLNYSIRPLQETISDTLESFRERGYL